MGQMYKLDFPSGKSYIGITEKTADERFKKHCSQSKRRLLVTRAILKYGKENVVITILADDCEWDDLCEMERSAIIEHKTKVPNGYNVSDGGEGVHGVICSEETRAKISANSKRQFKDPLQRKMLSERSKKAFQCEDYRKNHSEKRKAHYRSHPEILDIISKRIKALSSDPEYKRAQSERAKKQFGSDSGRLMQSLAAKKQFSTQEARDAQSSRLKKYFDNQEVRAMISEQRKLYHKNNPHIAMATRNRYASDPMVRLRKSVETVTVWARRKKIPFSEVSFK